MGTEDQLSGARRRHAAMKDAEWVDLNALAAHLDRGALLDIIDKLTVALAVQAQATTVTLGDERRSQERARSIQNELLAIANALDATNAPAKKRNDDGSNLHLMSSAERITWLAKESERKSAHCRCDCAEVLRIIRDASPKGNSFSYADNAAYLAKRSDELHEADVALCIPVGQDRLTRIRELVAQQEQLRATAKRLELSEEAMRRALAERDDLRQSVLNFIDDAKKRTGLQ